MTPTEWSNQELMQELGVIMTIVYAGIVFPKQIKLNSLLIFIDINALIFVKQYSYVNGNL